MRLRTSAFFLATLIALPLAAQDPTPSKLDVGPGLRRERERLSNYQWRLKTEMKVDGTVRMLKVEDVHLGPDGGLVKKMVKFDKPTEPTPFAENDPRARVYAPTTGTEEERLSEIAQDLMQYYARLSPERVAEWAKNAEVLPPEADHPGLVRMHGRGLGRPLDDAVLFFDPKTKTAAYLEVKTTVDPRILDIAFIRATFESLPQVRADLAPLWVPKRVFLNMRRGKRAVALEMETTDWRSWP
ncbi:MAG TPA: hypothetical protein VGM13_03490 [Thermoanaerobaculia bacterium]|jgi:hypothetical protein